MKSVDSRRAVRPAHLGTHDPGPLSDDPTPESAAQTTVVGADPLLLELLDLVNQVADTDATVLIRGDTGTGKELIAKILHEKSSRREAPFVAVNCGAISETLQESELFGHARGAFTGATERKDGLFRAAHGGTIFLDEISEMSSAFQVRLLRILQVGEYVPVGTTEPRYCDVRVVAATNEDLKPLIANRDFRRDLYYRLNIISVELPPLRDRRSDIPLLVKHFLDIFGPKYGKAGIRLDSECEEVLQRYDFPGNIRELENLVHRAVILCRNESIDLRLLPPEVVDGVLGAPAKSPTNFREAKNRVIERFEREFLTEMLGACGGIVSRAAQRSGLSERNFHVKLKKYGIHGQRFRA